MTFTSKEELHKQKIVNDNDLALAQNALNDSASGGIIGV